MGCLAITQAAGIIGGSFTASSVATWYPLLRKPAFTPPSTVFGPVWVALYVATGVAAFLVWRRGWTAPGVKGAAAWFTVQLVSNVAWSAAFFGARSPGAGLVVIGLLLAAIVGSVVAFFRVSRPAGVLMLPYLAWVCFATALNAGVWWLNRQ